MYKNSIYDKDYHPLLSGHETFPLRYGWLKKVFDAVTASDGDRSVFSADDAIARFGVGKNMVASMKHWATVAGVIEEVTKGKRFRTTEFGRLLFSTTEGIDPYMENPSSSWLIHWNLCANAKKTTWFWTFNHYPYPTFERDQLIASLKALSLERDWRKTSPTTLRNDVACFIRMYVPNSQNGRFTKEESLESPLSELGLIRSTDGQSIFHFSRGRKSTLNVGVFCYAVTDFWERNMETNSLSLESLVYSPGSPGRVFVMKENDVAELAMGLEEITQGAYRWSESTGLNQLLRTNPMKQRDVYRTVRESFVS